jgi:hypothetical protein
MSSFKISDDSMNSKSHQFDFDLSLCVLLAFSIPLTNVAISWVGIRFDLQRVVTILCLFRLFFLFGTRDKSHAYKILNVFSPLFLVVLYAALATFLQPVLLQDFGFASHEKIMSFIASRGFKFVNYIALLVYVASVLKNPFRMHFAVCSLALGFSLLEILGVVQSLTYLFSGIDLFPIKRIVEEGGVISYNDLSVPVNVFGLSFLRINSLAHEPKGLSQLLAFFFVFKIYWKSYRRAFSFNTFRWLSLYLERSLVLTTIVISMTFSSSGFFILFFEIVAVSFFYLFRKDRSTFAQMSRLVSRFAIPIVCLAFSAVFYFSLNPDYSSSPLQSFLGQSLFRRTGALEESINLESIYSTLDPEDGAFLYNIVHHPFMMLYGLGFGAFSSLSMEFFTVYGLTEYYSESPFARNIGIETISSVGIPGVIMVVACFDRLKCRANSRMRPLYEITSIIILSNFLVRSSETLFFFSLAVLGSLAVVDDFEVE